MCSFNKQYYLGDFNERCYLDWQLREGEMLYNEGAASLSHTDLLAHLIRDKGKAEKLMSEYGSLKTIATLSIDELTANNSRATAELIVAAVEFGKRSLSLEKPEVDANKPQDVYDFIAPSMRNLDQEHLKMLCLNTRSQVTKVCTIFMGTVNASIASPREIFRTALKNNAAAILLVHNHPSGISTPSSHDRSVTTNMIDSGKLLGIPVVDHIIIGSNGFYSFKENGHPF